MTKLFKLVLAAAVMGLLMAPTLALADYQVYVGYADTLRPSPDVPSPLMLGGTFMGHPVTGYFGNNCSLTTCDSGTVMIINTGSAAITVNTLSINDRANGATYALWGSPNFSLGAGDAAIFLENSGNNFDSSDFAGNIAPGGGPAGGISGAAGFDANNNNCSTGSLSTTSTCTNHSPIVTFTVNGTSADSNDSAHVLDTGGFDSADVNHNHSDGSVSTNESLQWRLIGTTGINNPGGQVPEPGSMVLFGSGLAGVAGLLRRKLRK